jgi:MFS family permease
MHWNVLTGSFLGWVFDGYEVSALVFSIGATLITLLPNSELPLSPIYAGAAIGLTLLGWGIGGVIGSVATDYIGRKRMMMISVTGYAAFTGLTALSQSFLQLGALRMLTGLFLGAEWSTGIALLTETWPDRARPKGAGVLQSGFGWGSLIAALAWFFIAPLGPQSWRYMYVLGIIPVVFTIYIWSQMTESERWAAAVREHRWAATPDQEKVLLEQFKQKRARPLTIVEIFRERVSRKYVILTFFVSLSSMVGWWAISSLLPRFVAGVATSEGLQASYWSGVSNIVYTVGAVVGYMIAGFVADSIGRRYMMLLTFAGGIVTNFVTFYAGLTLFPLIVMSGINGLFTLGFAYVWMAIYLPELFTSSVRSTAIGFVFNASRLIAFAFPIIAGVLILTLGGISSTAILLSLIYILGLIIPGFLPETKGKQISV